jgi:hypothetical protein
MTEQDAIHEYTTAQLLLVAQATPQEVWRLKTHPERQAHSTLYSRHGFVVHPTLGYINNEDDARFMATFDPPTVTRLLKRLAELERGNALPGEEQK